MAPGKHSKEGVTGNVDGCWEEGAVPEMALRIKSSRHSSPQRSSTGRCKHGIIILSGWRQKSLVLFSFFFFFLEGIRGVFSYTNEGLSTRGRFRKAHQD